MKTNKSYKRRLKVTKNGKIVARHKGQNHYNAKESGEKKMAKRGDHINPISMSSKSRSRFITNISK
jgi:ribosomal protein L35